MDATCPSCQKVYRNVRQELIGRKALCTCGHTFRLENSTLKRDSLTSDQSEPRTSEVSNAVTSDNAATSDSVDLSSASVFENSYSDLEQILSGQGSTAPLSSQSDGGSGNFQPARQNSDTRPAPSTGREHDRPAQASSYRGTGMSVGFLAAVGSGCMAAWFSLFVLSSRYSVLELQPFRVISQTLNDINRATFGDLTINVGLERSFVLLGWVIWGVAACLICLAIGQLINAFTKLFRRRHLLPGIDGITGLTAILLLFMLLSTLFLHFSHMRQLNRDLIQTAGGQIDEGTVLGRNLQALQSAHRSHSQQFMTCMIAASSIPLCVGLLSLSRVYITLGEADVIPSRRESP